MYIMKMHKKYYTNEETNWTQRSKINEDEIGKLCGKEFRIKIVKMIKKKLENKMEKMQESISEERPRRVKE